jgi:hypothetical protein
MDFSRFLLVLIAALGGTAMAAESTSPPPTYAGLVAVQQRNLDRLYVRPDASLARYQKVIIDPVTVAYSKDWDKSVNDPRHPARIGPEDARRIAEETTANVGSILAETLKSRGYEIVTAPGPDVLRLTPHVTDLYVNAPDLLPPGRTRSYARDAGEATVTLLASDASNGVLLAVLSDRGTAGETLRLSRANSVSNNFWFDGMFRKFATDSVDAIKNTPRT